ncbi:MAG: type II toxin-antitoxin system Phd/YefM family antitoxin [Deltaproteobacteria bacterium]|nr:type II toxin-antitoxin system Phd/YefM family antitoxin [Deltaproteobacteria bacterium]
MEKIVPISDLQSKAKQFVEQVNKTREPVIITQRGRAAAILVDYETYEGRVATQDEMSYPDWEKRLTKANAEKGKGVTLEDFKKGKRGHGRKK